MMTHREQDLDIHTLMAGQHGAATTKQARRTVSQRRQAGLVDGRTWRRDGQRVVVSRSAPATWHQQVMVTVLATRGIASHDTAARLHRLDGFARCNEVHVTLRYNQARLYHDGAVVHISRLLDRADQLTVEGIPTVIVPVCLLQLGEGSTAAMMKALDGTLRDGVNPAWIRSVAARYDRRGRSSPKALLRAVDERVDGTLPRSWFQRLAAQLFTDAGLTTVDEHPVHDGSRLLAELDLAIPELQIGIECQSWQWHGTPEAQRRDAARKRALRRLGWEIVDVWWSDLDRIDDVLATVRVIAGDRRLRML
jgi:hypothetical protein